MRKSGKSDCPPPLGRDGGLYPTAPLKPGPPVPGALPHAPGQARCGPAGPQAAEGHPLPAYPPGRTAVRRRGLSVNCHNCKKFDTIFSSIFSTIFYKLFYNRRNESREERHHEKAVELEADTRIFSDPPRYGTAADPGRPGGHCPGLPLGGTGGGRIPGAAERRPGAGGEGRNPAKAAYGRQNRPAPGGGRPRAGEQPCNGYILR